MTESDSLESEAPDPRPLRICLGVGALLVLSLGLFAFRGGTEKEDPAQFRQKVDAMARNLIRGQWASMRQTVIQIGTDEGAKAFFASHPGLAPRIRSEAAFLKLARSWRPLVQPLPEVLPGLESRELSYVKGAGREEMRYRVPNGTYIFMKWSGGRLVELRIY